MYGSITSVMVISAWHISLFSLYISQINIYILYIYTNVYLLYDPSYCLSILWCSSSLYSSQIQLNTIVICWICLLCLCSVQWSVIVWLTHCGLVLPCDVVGLGSILDRVLACCPTAPSHYLIHCWFIFSKILQKHINTFSVAVLLIWFTKKCAVQCHYNVANFLPKPHNRHPIACPWGCLSWVQSPIYILPLSLQCMWYRQKLDGVLTALGCRWKYQLLNDNQPVGLQMHIGISELGRHWFR